MVIVSVIAVLSKEPNEQKFQDRRVASTILNVEASNKIGERVGIWLQGILHEEPGSTKLLALSHTIV